MNDKRKDLSLLRLEPQTVHTRHTSESSAKLIAPSSLVQNLSRFVLQVRRMCRTLVGGDLDDATKSHHTNRNQEGDELNLREVFRKCEEMGKRRKHEGNR